MYSMDAFIQSKYSAFNIYQYANTLQLDFIC